MSLQQWSDNGWLRPHKTSSRQIAELFEIVDRDIRDSEGAVSMDWQFGIAYNAALKLCTVMLYAEGFRSERTLQHYRTIQALPLILGEERRADALYLDACRARRNVVEYEYIGAVSEVDVQELKDFVWRLREEVVIWLKRAHPDLAPSDSSESA